LRILIQILFRSKTSAAGITLYFLLILDLLNIPRLLLGVLVAIHTWILVLISDLLWLILFYVDVGAQLGSGFSKLLFSYFLLLISIVTRSTWPGMFIMIENNLISIPLLLILNHELLQHIRRGCRSTTIDFILIHVVQIESNLIVKYCLRIEIKPCLICLWLLIFGKVDGPYSHQLIVWLIRSTLFDYMIVVEMEFLTVYG